MWPDQEHGLLHAPGYQFTEVVDLLVLLWWATRGCRRSRRVARSRAPQSVQVVPQTWGGEHREDEQRDVPGELRVRDLDQPVTRWPIHRLGARARWDREDPLGCAVLSVGAAHEPQQPGQ
jgi:hypothetical protein